MEQILEAMKVIQDLNFKIAELNQKLDCFLSYAKEIVCVVPCTSGGSANYCFDLTTSLKEKRAQFDEVVKLNQK